jgi:hypothetical protein
VSSEIRTAADSQEVEVEQSSFTAAESNPPAKET